MANYFLSEEDRRKIARMLAQQMGGKGSHRPTPHRRQPKADTGPAPPQVEMAMAIDTIPGVLVLQTDEITPGQGDVKLLDWIRDNEGKYITPLERLEVKTEDDPDYEGDPPAPQIDMVRKAVNLSRTDIRASPDEPILLSGQMQFVADEPPILIVRTFDLREIPFFEVGETPAGQDDEYLQIPYHPGGSPFFYLDSEKCI